MRNLTPSVSSPHVRALQSIKEAAYMNIPVIAFCDTDSDLPVRSVLCIVVAFA